VNHAPALVNEDDHANAKEEAHRPAGTNLSSGIVYKSQADDLSEITRQGLEPITDFVKRIAAPVARSETVHPV